MVPVAGVEPARVISPTDFESASSTNSNTPAHMDFSIVQIPEKSKRNFAGLQVLLFWGVSLSDRATF